MAIYNNGMPMNYTQPYQQQIVPQVNQPANPNPIIWVQGEAGAKSYLVAPNSTVQLWDSESQTIYLKSADASGMPSIKVLDYTVRQQPNKIINNNSNDEFVTKQELQNFRDEINKLIKEGLGA